MVDISSVYQQEYFLKKFDLLGLLCYQGEKDKGRLRDICLLCFPEQVSMEGWIGGWKLWALMLSFMRGSSFHWSYGSGGGTMARLEQHRQEHQVCMARVLNEQLVKKKSKQRTS